MLAFFVVLIGVLATLLPGTRALRMRVQGVDQLLGSLGERYLSLLFSGPLPGAANIIALSRLVSGGPDALRQALIKWCIEWESEGMRRLLQVIQQYPEIGQVWLSPECLERLPHRSVWALYPFLKDHRMLPIGLVHICFTETFLDLARIVEALRAIEKWDPRGSFRLSHLPHLQLPWPSISETRGFFHVPLHRIITLPLLHRMAAQGLDVELTMARYGLRALSRGDQEAITGILFWMDTLGKTYKPIWWWQAKVWSMPDYYFPDSMVVKEEAGRLAGRREEERTCLQALRALMPLEEGKGTGRLSKLMGLCCTQLPPCSLPADLPPKDGRRGPMRSGLLALLWQIQLDQEQPRLPSLFLLRALLHLAVRDGDENALHELGSLLRARIDALDDLSLVWVLESSIVLSRADPFEYCRRIFGPHLDRLLAIGGLHDSHPLLLGCLSVTSRRRYFRRWERQPVPAALAALVHRCPATPELDIPPIPYGALDILLNTHHNGSYPSMLCGRATGKVLHQTLWQLILAYPQYAAIKFVRGAKMLVLRTSCKHARAEGIAVVRMVVGLIAYLDLYYQSPVGLSPALIRQIACQRATRAVDGVALFALATNVHLVRLVRVAYNLGPWSCCVGNEPCR